MIGEVSKFSPTYELIRKTKVEDLVLEENEVREIPSLAEVTVKDVHLKKNSVLIIAGRLIYTGDWVQEEGSKVIFLEGGEKVRLVV